MSEIHSTTNAIAVSVVDSEPRIDSRLVATELGVEIKATHQLVDKYSSQFQELGQLPFKMEAVKREGERGTKYEKFYLMNEDQTYFLMALVRNTAQSVDLKKRLVQAFADCRSRLIKPAELTREQILVMALESERERMRLAQVIEEQRPMVEFHDEVSKTADEMTIAETCSVLFNGSVMEKTLRAWLKTNHWLDKRPGMRKPTKWAMQRGFMRVRELPGNDGRMYPTPVVCAPGITTLRHLYRTGELFVAAIQKERMTQIAARMI